MLKIPERSSTTVTLYDGPDFDKFERLTEAVKYTAEKSEAKRLGDDPIVSDAAAELDAFTAEAAERGQVVKVQAPPKWKCRELVLAHPPREDNPADARRGYNCDTYPDDFVPASLPIDGQFENEKARADFLDNLSEGNFLRLLDAALRVNDERGVIDPKGPSISSRLDRTSDESLQPPARLG